MDPELYEALERLTTDLRAEIQSGDAGLRARPDAATAEMRRHFDVVGEALRGDIRSLAELTAMSNARVGRRMDEHDSRPGGLEGGVRELEARVSMPEEDRKSPGPAQFSFTISLRAARRLFRALPRCGCTASVRRKSSAASPNWPSARWHSP